MTDATAVVFVHGAWHGPWCWSDWEDAAERRGHEAVAVTLPGHDQPGSSTRIWTRMSRMLATVEAALANRSGPTVVVGHSMRGYLVQRALEEPPPNVVGAALYLAVPPMLARWPRPGHVGVPVLVVAAERDGLFSVHQQRDLAAAYHVEPVVIEGAGHDLMLEPQGPEAASVVLQWADDRFDEGAA